MPNAVMKGSVAIPFSLRPHPQSLRSALTATYEPMGEPPVEVKCYDESRTHLFVPRQFGLDYCKRHGIEIDDRTSPGQDAAFTLINPPRDYQVDTLADVLDATDSYYDFLFRAHTG